VRVDRVNYIGLGTLRTCVLGCRMMDQAAHSTPALPPSCEVHCLHLPLACERLPCPGLERFAWGFIRFLAEGGMKKIAALGAAKQRSSAALVHKVLAQRGRVAARCTCISISSWQM
jgi:hypothetical protein